MGGESKIALKTTTSRTAALCGVANTVHVLLEIETSKVEASLRAKRPDFELCIVLDKSGSMQGPKLEGSKMGIKFVIDNLGSSDTMHLVSYDDSATVEFESGVAAMKDLLKSKTEEVRVAGSTNIGAGLLAAHSIFQRTCSSKSKRIFLFSDGLVNAGPQGEGLLQIVDALQQDGIQTSTFGIGADFSEELMKEIALRGRGDYSFLDEEENIHAHIEEGLKSLMATVGVDTVVRGRGTGGCVLKKIFGGHDTVKGAILGDLKEDNKQQLLFEVEVTPTTPTCVPILELVLSYKDPQTGNEGRVPASVTFAVTEEAEEALKASEESTKVEIALLLMETAAVERQIVQLLGQGQVAQAIALKKENVARLERILERDQSGFVAAVLERTKKTLAEMQVRGTPVRSMTKSCHYDSHCTTSGSLSKVAFKTPQTRTREVSLPSGTAGALPWQQLGPGGAAAVNPFQVGSSPFAGTPAYPPTQHSTNAPSKATLASVSVSLAEDLNGCLLSAGVAPSPPTSTDRDESQQDTLMDDVDADK